MFVSPISTINPVVREFHTVYFDQAFSPDQNDLALVDNFGQLFTISVHDQSNVERQIIHEKNNFYSVATLSNGLIAGSGHGQISFFDWGHLLETDREERIKPKWTVAVGHRELNSIAVLDEKQFVAGSGDGRLTLRDAMNPDAVLCNFDGHTDQVNQIAAGSNNTFVSCSSDGTVLQFDARNGNAVVRKIDINQHNGLQRPGFSKAVLAVALQDNFVLAGGGPSLAKFDLNSGLLLQTLPTPKSIDDFDIHSIEVSRERIGVGTSTGVVLAYSHAGTLINEIPVSHGAVLNLTTAANGNHRHVVTAVSECRMRYGKIYFYDRCGNKVQDDLNPDVKEDVLTLPVRAERGHNTIQMLARGGPDFARLSPPFAARSQGFVPTDPFAKLDIGLDSPTIGPPPDELRSNDIDYSIRRRNLDSVDSTDDYNGGGRCVLPGDILSPLNDLQSSPDRRDDEKMAMMRGIEKLDFEENDGITVSRRNADLSDDILSPGRRARVGFTVESANEGGRLKNAQSSDEIIDRRYVEEEASELCEHCLLEERRAAAARDESRLQKELQKHVAGVNDDIRGAAYRRKGRDLLPMGVLPPFLNRDDDALRLRSLKAKDVYRRELEDEMARKVLNAEIEKVKDKAMHNDANMRDALAYARDQDNLRRINEDERARNKDILEKQMELSRLNRKESAQRLEWWERKSMPGVQGVERDAAFLGDQLRRNEALQRSVDLLEQFKGEQREENLARRALMKQHYDNLRSRIEEQTDLIRGRRRYPGSDADARVTTHLPSVYKAWEEAHLRNDKRYRVLQDFGGVATHPRHIEEHARCIRCRRCKRLIRKEVNRRVLDEA